MCVKIKVLDYIALKMPLISLIEIAILLIRWTQMKKIFWNVSTCFRWYMLNSIYYFVLQWIHRNINFFIWFIRLTFANEQYVSILKTN